MSSQQNRQALLQAFDHCQPILIALGNETRQLIIAALMTAGCSPGLRVGELTEQTNLSRPAVSHHLKILMEAGIVTRNKQGTMNFYALDAASSRIHCLKDLVHCIDAITGNKEESR